MLQSALPVAQASAPILILIAAGWMARAVLGLDATIWKSIDRVNFFILIPCLIVSTLVGIDIRAAAGLRVILTIVAALTFLCIVLFFLAPILRRRGIDAPAFTSVFQTATRWNASVAIVVAQVLFDDAAIVVIALIMVALMPLVNVVNVVVLARALPEGRASLGGTFRQVARNPILIGCTAGIVVSVLDFSLPGPIVESLSLLGRASTATILLSLGAGLILTPRSVRILPFVVSAALKLAAMPALVWIAGFLLNVPGEVLVVAVIATAMPTAANGYVLAQEMGGDAPLYASICTLQTLLAFATVPIWMAVSPLIVRAFGP